MDWGILVLGLVGVAAIGFLVWAMVRPKSKEREESSSQTPVKVNEREEQTMNKWTLLLAWNIALTIAIIYGFVSGSWTTGREIKALRETVDSRLHDISGSGYGGSLDGIERELSSIDRQLFDIYLKLR